MIATPRLILAALLCAVPLLAQSRPTPTGFSTAERQAFDMAMHGASEAALDAFVALLETPPGVDRRAAVEAEVHVAQALELAERRGAVELAARFAALAERSPLAASSPPLADRLRLAALQLALRAADRERAAALTADLGFVTDWQICGPLDNERGAGFARRFAPEQALDLDGEFTGARRPVRWRPMPVAAIPGGYVDLDSMLRPDDQVLAYATTALIAAEPTDAALLLGSDESVAVFLNGVEVFRRDARRPCRPDQDAVPLPLTAGVNLLLLKVADQEGPFGFQARLRRSDGRPLGTAVRADASRAALAAAAQTAPRATAATPIDRGALDDLAVTANDSPADAFRLATLLASAEPDDPTERRDRELAARAVAGLPEFPAARMLLARTRVRAGRAEEKDENARRADLLACIAADPRHVAALRELAAMDLEDLGAVERAEELCRRALAVAPADGETGATLAAALERAGLARLAERAWLDAAARDPEDHAAPEAVRGALRALRQRGRVAAAASAADWLATRAASVDDALAQADLLRWRGQRAAAIAVLEHAAALWPFERRFALRLAAEHRAAGDIDAASDVLQARLTVCPQDAAVWFELAQLPLPTEQRVAWLARGVELDPNAKREARLLEFLKADAASFHAAYEIDADAWIASDQGPPADTTDEADPLHELLRHTVIRAFRNGTTSTYRHRIVRVLNARGAESLQRWVVPHAFGSQRARLLSLRVRKADGQELRPRLLGPFATLPPLAAGDVVDARERVDDDGPGIFGDYFGHIHDFSSPDGVPVRRSELTLVLEPGRGYSFQAVRGVPEPVIATATDGAEVRTWRMDGVARRAIENRSPSAKETAPLLRVTTYADWNAFAGWWWNLIRRQTEISDAMRAKVAELTADCATDAERIAAIYRFVTTDVRYEAWEFGVHGYKPYSTAVVFDRRHGDCKDKSLLLNAMLSVVGIEAWPVLIWAEPNRSQDDLTLPMVQHFNHCISYVPPAGDRPGMFLDGTATWHPTDTLPTMDQGARVLVVSGPQAEVVDVPYVAALANADVRRYRIELEPSGRGRLRFVAEPARNQAVGLREFLGNTPAQREDALERILARDLGALDVTAIEASDPEDLSMPVRMTVDATVEAAAAARGDRLELRPTFRDAGLLQFADSETRDLALLVGLPRGDAQSIRYTLPPGFVPIDLPPPVTLRENFGSFELRWRVDGDALVVDRTWTMTNPRIEPQEYPAFRRFAEAVETADRRTVELRRGAAREGAR